MRRENFHTLPAVAAFSPEQLSEARQLAERVGLPLMNWEETENQLVLTVTAERLELHERIKGRSQPAFVDFSSTIAAARRQEGLKQPLARAAGLKPGLRPMILDATPGLGRDAFVLAALGCRVLMVERAPIAHALLADGLRRGLCNRLPEMDRMRLEQGDAMAFMTQTESDQRPDVIYLDPMHPERTKTALVKKEMRLLREVVGDDIDADHLLMTALRHARQRVVVKRPRLGLPLAGATPHAVVGGRTIRYDLYFPATR